MSVSSRDLEGVKECIKVLEGYIALCQAGNYEFAMDISTQLYKLLFDRSRNNGNQSLIERVVERSKLLFHPLKNQNQ